MIYVTGDCHGNFRRFQSDCFPEQANMTKDDTVIITGDCGGVWFGDSRDDETLDWLERLPFTLAFVCGNHENYDALARYPVAEWRVIVFMIAADEYQREGQAFQPVQRLIVAAIMKTMTRWRDTP